MDFLALLVATGLVSGATYGLIAMGFALIYKSTGVVNFAQGELVMLTAYVSFSLASALELSFFPLLAGRRFRFPWSIGLVLERIIIRPMLGEPRLLDRHGDGRPRGDPARHCRSDLGFRAARIFPSDADTRRHSSPACRFIRRSSVCIGALGAW